MAMWGRRFPGLVAVVSVLAPLHALADAGFSDPMLLNARVPEYPTAYYYNSHLATDGNGTCVAVWQAWRSEFGFDSDVLIARSWNSGLSWTSAIPPGYDAMFDIEGGNTFPHNDDALPQVACDGLGNWLAVWVSNRNNPSLVHYVTLSRSSDNGASWSSAIALTNGVYGGDSATIATDRAGHWVVAWGGKQAAFSQGILCRESADNGQSWTTRHYLDASMYDGNLEHGYPRIASNGAGVWIAVWSALQPSGGSLGSDGDILAARSYNNGATWTTPAPVNLDATTDSRTDRFPKLAADGSGNWVVGWNALDSESDAFQPFVAHSSNNGNDWSSPIELADATPSSWAIDVATDKAGTWNAVWSEAGSMRLSTSGDAGTTWSVPALLHANSAAQVGWTEFANIAYDDGADVWLVLWDRMRVPAPSMGTFDILLSRKPLNPAGLEWTLYQE